MSRSKFPRAFLAARSVLILLTVVAPLANASDKGKKFENDGNALQAQTNSLLKKLNTLSSANPAVTLAVNTYITTVDTATATLQGAIKTAYKAAVSAAQQGPSIRLLQRPTSS